MFAHNGQLKGVKKRPLSYYEPVGTTDSEHAFCWMMDQLRAEFTGRPQRGRRLWTAIRDLARDLDELGVFSFLLSDSFSLFAYCSNNLCWITRRAPFGKARLIDTGVTIDFSRETTPRDVVTVVASRPLTDNEHWNKMRKGDFLVFQSGELKEL